MAANMVKTRRALVLGGCGALGESYIRVLHQAGWRVTAIDTHEAVAADEFYTIGQGDQAKDYARVHESLKAQEAGFDIMVNAAGGWAPSDFSNAEDLFESTHAMSRASVDSSLGLAFLATHFLKPKGTCAFHSTLLTQRPNVPAADMAGYVASKAATNSIATSLGMHLRDRNPQVFTWLIDALDSPANMEWMQPANLTSRAAVAEATLRVQERYMNIEKAATINAIERHEAVFGANGLNGTALQLTKPREAALFFPDFDPDATEPFVRAFVGGGVAPDRVDDETINDPEAPQPDDYFLRVRPALLEESLDSLIAKSYHTE